MTLRPLSYLALVFLGIALLDGLLLLQADRRKTALQRGDQIIRTVVSGLGLTDICVSTEARYTRHPAVSDPLVPFMDYPGAIEHFPSGSFWAPPGAVPPETTM